MGKRSAERIQEQGLYEIEMMRGTVHGVQVICPAVTLARISGRRSYGHMGACGSRLFVLSSRNCERIFLSVTISSSVCKALPAF